MAATWGRGPYHLGGPCQGLTQAAHGGRAALDSGLPIGGVWGAQASGRRSMPGGTGPQPTKEENHMMKGKIDIRNTKIIGKDDECPMLCGLPIVVEGRAARLEMDDRGWYAMDRDGWRLYHLDGREVEVRY